MVPPLAKTVPQIQNSTTSATYVGRMSVHFYRRTTPLGEDFWKEDAACVGTSDPDLFFPRRGESVNAARTICSSCPVREDCLETALSVGPADDWGIWGGMTLNQRQEIRRQRKRSRREARMA